MIVVLGVLGVLALLGCMLTSTDRARRWRNVKNRNAYAAAWFKTYPHELADGTLQWYPVVHEMDHGCPAARG